MNLRGSIISGIILSLCLNGVAYAADAEKTRSSVNKSEVEENQMFYSQHGKAIVEKTAYFSDYEHTEGILNTYFYPKKPEKIKQFLLNAQAAKINLDQLFLGTLDSIKYTVDGKGYTKEEQEQCLALLQNLVAQQFSNAEPCKNPTYNVNPGAPGSGKTYALQKEFGIDVAKAKFPTNHITIGPDLVVMPQMERYIAACKLTGPERAEAMKNAYLHDRDFSNFIANFMFVMAMTEKMNIIHDSTMTSGTAPSILEHLGKLGYIRTGKVLMASKDSRLGALAERTKQNGYALVEPEVAAQKGKAIFEQIANEAYMHNRFDKLTFYVQPPKFHSGEGDMIAVAKYNAETDKMQILDGAEEHIDSIINPAKNKEDLSDATYAKLLEVVGTCEKSSPLAKITKKLSS